MWVHSAATTTTTVETKMQGYSDPSSFSSSTFTAQSIMSNRGSWALQDCADYDDTDQLDGFGRACSIQKANN